MKLRRCEELQPGIPLPDGQKIGGILVEFFAPGHCYDRVASLRQMMQLLREGRVEPSADREFRLFGAARRQAGAARCELIAKLVAAYHALYKLVTESQCDKTYIFE